MSALTHSSAPRPSASRPSAGATLLSTYPAIAAGTLYAARDRQSASHPTSLQSSALLSFRDRSDRPWQPCARLKAGEQPQRPAHSLGGAWAEHRCLPCSCVLVSHSPLAPLIDASAPATQS